MYSAGGASSTRIPMLLLLLLLLWNAPAPQLATRRMNT